ncbi:universal stress protein [Echinicola jeungdonensis]|uniref:Universal stress protein n=1 Tax=Echinicola jeungdonensis TaxID=709343 RepID=A0ABV5J820_9BACT|nr:universal stress protein [Echinicola jeungdonensis]MDN3668030.1 universal stress protein [Echinicola jeungdonensis]
MKNILVLTDFSDVAYNASLFAMKMAKQINAEIHFLHVIYTSENRFYLSGNNKLDESRKNIEIEKSKAGMAILMTIAKSFGIIAKNHITYNKAHFDIEDHVKSYKDDYVVIGSHGANGIKELFFGSNAQKIIRYSPCPTLVIKGKAENTQIRQIAFASLFHEEDHKSFRKVLEFADTIGAQVSLLYVNTPFIYEKEDKISERIQQFLSKVPGYPEKQFKSYIEFGKYSEEGMLDFIKENEIDLLAIPTSGRNPISRMLKSSFTEKIVNHIKKPVLTILEK